MITGTVVVPCCPPAAAPAPTLGREQPVARSPLDMQWPLDTQWPLDITAMVAPAGARIRGEVDISTLPTLELALEILVDRACDATLDLYELAFIDVSGLRALARAAIQLRSTGRCLRLRGADPQTRRILGLLGWAELFEILR